MKLSPKEIEDVAELAKLHLTEEEKERYAEELSVVFDYVEKLQEVDTEGVEITSQVTGLQDVVREDEIKDISKEKKQRLIQQFPQKEGKMLKVKAVFDNNE